MCLKMINTNTTADERPNTTNEQKTERRRARASEKERWEERNETEWWQQRRVRKERRERECERASETQTRNSRAKKMRFRKSSRTRFAYTRVGCEVNTRPVHHKTLNRANIHIVASRMLAPIVFIYFTSSSNQKRIINTKLLTKNTA